MGGGGGGIRPPPPPQVESAQKSPGQIGLTFVEEILLLEQRKENIVCFQMA